jgi:zinc transporter ZupT
MSDELDPQLLRLFADANAPLSDDGFHARVMARIERPRGWRGIAYATGSTVHAIGAGLVTGVTAPFRQRMSLGKLLTIAIGAIASCLALLAV